MRLLFLKILFIFIICRPIFAMQIPGEKYFVDINKLAEPYATKSASNSHHNLDLETCELKVPKGFKVKVFSNNLQNPRNIKVSKNDDVFIAESRTGKIKILRDTDNDGISDIHYTFAKDFKQPFGI